MLEMDSLAYKMVAQKKGHFIKNTTPTVYCMQVTKFEHCCLLIEENGLRVLTDPGIYAQLPEKLDDIDVILFTHIHPDHLEAERLKKILTQNPHATIYTNQEVGKVLQEQRLAFRLLEDGQKTMEKGVPIEGIGKEHAIIYKQSPCHNTGYLINNHLFYPGDALTIPTQEIKVLALPVAGMWLKLADAIDYAKKINPKTCFPVHDGILKNPGFAHTIPKPVLESAGIEWNVLENAQEVHF